MISVSRNVCTVPTVLYLSLHWDALFHTSSKLHSLEYTFGDLRAGGQKGSDIILCTNTL